MNREKIPVLICALLAIALILIASITSIVSDQDGKPYSFNTVLGTQVKSMGVMVSINSIIHIKPLEHTVSIG